MNPPAAAIELEGRLGPRDTKHHLRHSFDVPAGAVRLLVCYEHDPDPPGRLPTMVCLSLFDPAGFRGSGHRDGTSHAVLIGRHIATPGYRAGPIAAGTWTVVLHAHRVTSSCGYRLRVEWELEGDRRATPAAGEPRWYRGDLHAHTRHSDGSWDVAELLAHAMRVGLDFVTLADHNTVAQLAELERLSSPRLLVMAGFELTTYRGHALSLGTREWIDWGVLEEGRSMAAVAREVTARGGLFVIAHPLSRGDPECTGCAWEVPEMMPGESPAVEVWNGPWDGDSNNDPALALWYRWLAEGRRIVATAGTDAHGDEPGGGRVGYNVVRAAARSEAAILEAVRAGHLYLSSGPHLELDARANGRSATMGDTLRAEELSLTASWRDCPAECLLRLVCDGVPAEDLRASGSGAHSWSGLRARSALVELRDAAGLPLALTNPIYRTDPG